MSDHPLLSNETPLPTPITATSFTHLLPEASSSGPSTPITSASRTALPPRPPRSPRRSILQHIRRTSDRFSLMSLANVPIINEIQQQLRPTTWGYDSMARRSPPRRGKASVPPPLSTSARQGLNTDRRSWSSSIKALDLAESLPPPTQSFVFVSEGKEPEVLPPFVPSVNRPRKPRPKSFLTSIPPPPPDEPLPPLPPAPEVRVTRASILSDKSKSASRPHVAPIATRSSGLHPFAAVQSMMEQGSGSRSPSPKTPTHLQKGKGRAEPLLHQTKQASPRPRTRMVGANSFITRLASKASLPSFSATTVTNGQETLDPTRQYPPRIVTQPSRSRSRSFLRPAPETPARSTKTPDRYAGLTSAGGAGVDAEGGLIEIPRFKRRDLNLSFVKCGLAQRLMWLGLWIFWATNSLGSLFFDINIIYMLVQCTRHADETGGSSRRWAFATAAYAVCWGLSALGVWMIWELYYEFWRRWHTSRPAIEPIYSSLPATLHLSLTSFHHFAFLLHVRLSCLGTPYTTDFVPETCYALLQLAPGLLPQLPRVGIGIILLLSYWQDGDTNRPSSKDPHFFDINTGQLTTYSAGTILGFEAYVGVRLVTIVFAALGLVFFSKPHDAIGRHRGGRPGGKPRRRKGEHGSGAVRRDPSRALAPQRSWLTREDRYAWGWRERSRKRLQDAFELCLTRRLPSVTALPTHPDAIPSVLSSEVIPRHGLSSKQLSRLSTPSASAASAAGKDFTPSQHTSFYTPGAGNTPTSLDDDVKTINKTLLTPGAQKELDSPTSATSPSAALLSSKSGPRNEHPNVCKSGADHGTDDTEKGPLGSKPGSRSGSNDGHGPPSSFSSASFGRKRASSLGTINRARSTSFTRLKESVETTATSVARRVRSGTVLSRESRYSRVTDEEEKRYTAKDFNFGL